MSRREEIIRRLEDKDYRDAFVSELVHQGFAHQVRVTRESRGWSQNRLAEEAGMRQSRISTIEDPNNEGLTLATAKRIASALDVALIFRLVPFGKFADFLTGNTWISAADWVEPIPSHDDDTGGRGGHRPSRVDGR